MAGGFVLRFYRQLVQPNKLKVINTCDEQGAGIYTKTFRELVGQEKNWKLKQINVK
ncbi:MAG TPA: hypothetical protein VE130_14910 [Nitrososphaeraceae archaeon]|nr:hypothetical protein [Nitrososphaeraceae archaeon]